MVKQLDRMVMPYPDQEALMVILEMSVIPNVEDEYHALVAAVRANLEEETLSQLWAVGRALLWEHAVELALTYGIRGHRQT